MPRDRYRTYVASTKTIRREYSTLRREGESTRKQKVTKMFKLPRSVNYRIERHDGVVFIGTKLSVKIRLMKRTWRLNALSEWKIGIDKVLLNCSQKYSIGRKNFVQKMYVKVSSKGKRAIIQIVRPPNFQEFTCADPRNWHYRQRNLFSRKPFRHALADTIPSSDAVDSIVTCRQPWKCTDRPWRLRSYRGVCEQRV